MKTIKNVLYAEDDEMVALLVKDILEDENISVTHANNLETALDYMKKEKYDLYMTDGQYPLNSTSPIDKEAWQIFYNQVKKLGKDNSILVITGNTDIVDRLKQSKTPCIGKPFTSEQLKQEIYSLK